MCGIIGVSNTKHVALDAYHGLHAIQHRGKDGNGILTLNGSEFNGPITRKGIVYEAFPETEIRGLEGFVAIGQVRYRTKGKKNKYATAKDAQPFLLEQTKNGPIAIAHNGDFDKKAEQLKRQYMKHGSIFQTTSDTEVIAHNFAHAENGSLEELLTNTLEPVKDGAYSLVMIVKGKLVGARDVYGFHPLVLGKKEGGYILASETTCLDRIKARYVREIEPGEVVIVEDDHIKSFRPFGSKREDQEKKCTFEFAYFSRPDGLVFGTSVARVRRRLGQMLAEKFGGLGADVFGPVPDSGNDAAVGYGQKVTVPFEPIFTRDHFAGRTFIDPDENGRAEKVRLKLNPYPGLEGKTVTIIDDSLVRGTTSKELVRMLKEDAGVAKVNLLIAFWEFAYRCKRGIDTATDDELLSNSRFVEQIRQEIGAHHLGFLAKSDVLQAVKDVNPSLEGLCTSCHDGFYPGEVVL